MNINNYMEYIAKTPKEKWENLNQATINSKWEDTTLIYNIKEQRAFPFVDEYEDIEVWVDNISDDIVNTSKVYSDFVRVIFKDCNRQQNYKGQYYKMSLDNEHEETYICYDRLNILSQTKTSKLVRCNNVLTYIDECGKIITMPCYLGTDISSTNNLVSKDGTVPNERMIIMVQANEDTLKIRRNQRFMFEHSDTFKVEEINHFMREDRTNGAITCLKIYVDFSTILESDNKELNLCDYYKAEHIEIKTENKHIVVNPNMADKIRVDEEIKFTCYVESDGEVLSDIVTCVADGLRENYTSFEQVDDGYILSEYKYYKGDIITLTFTADECEDVVLNIKVSRDF